MSTRPSLILIATGLIGVALTIWLVVGTDHWKRPVTEPNADASYYYVYLPSLVLDGDLDLANQYEVTKNYYRWGKTPIGRPANPFGVGPAIFQLPAFVVGHGLAKITGDRDDGFSGYETTLVMWTAIPCTLGALLFAYRLARRRFGASAAYLGAIFAIAAGPILYYTTRQPGYAHPYATLFATWLIERWDASYFAIPAAPARAGTSPSPPSTASELASPALTPRSLRTWIVLGALAGAATLARPQLVAWALLLPVAVLDDFRKRGDVPLSKLLLRWAAGAAMCLIVFSPQLFAWKALYGSWYVVPQGDDFMRWDDAAWSETLFSSRNGLFPWSPLYLPMMIGVLWLARESVRLPLALLLGLLAQAEINGAAWDWWAGGSYGGRRFDSTFALFAVGAAALIAAAGRALQRGQADVARIRDRVIGWLAAAGLVGATLIAIANVELTAETSVISARIGGGVVPSKVWEDRVGGARGWLAGRLADLGTFPIRTAFAWRHGVDRDAYDRLVGVHHLGELYPALVGDRDKKRDTLHVAVGPPFTDGLQQVAGNRAKLLAGRARVRFGINRRDEITLRIPVEGIGRVVARWNDQVGEVTGRGAITLSGHALRGVNTLEIEGPAGTLVSAIELIVGKR